MLPPVIPIFPLPNVVLFPNVFLPLHIFEPRYRDMVRDGLAGDRLIGMTLLKPGWEGEYEGRPPVYPIGCAGLITHAERLPGGEYNIVLRGLEKFRISSEDRGGPYRRALVEAIDDPLPDAARQTVRAERRRLERLLLERSEHGGVEGARLPEAMPDEDVVNALAQYLALEPAEKQALLEHDGVLARCRALIELLEMKAMLSGRAWGSSV
jgi:hypothetical protein